MEGLIVGILVAIVLLFGCVLVLLVVLLRRSRQESSISESSQGFKNIELGLTELQGYVKGRQDFERMTAESIKSIQLGVAQMQSYAAARQEVERRTADSIRRLEAVIAGTQTKGAAGENILETIFAKLPVEWQVRNFHVNNKPVEFGLRLPNGLVMPIDSKWPATSLIEQFVAADKPVEQQKLKVQIEAAVLTKARELRKYIDPRLTVSFGVVAVPDSVYDLSAGILGEALQMNVVVIGYSMFLPYLLLVFHTIQSTSQGMDVQQVGAFVQSVQKGIAGLTDELEGRFSRAMTMLENSRNEMRAHMGRLNGSLVGLKLGSPAQTKDASTTSRGDGPA